MISDFGRDILEVLDEAQKPLSSIEVAARLSENRERRVIGGHARVYLEHALGEYVERTASDGWAIRSPHHGTFASSKRPASKQKSKQTSEGRPGAPDQKKRISKLILRVLARTDERLKAKELSNAISRVVEDVSTTDINGLLYGELNDRVEKDKEHRWGLSKKNSSDGEVRDGKDSDVSASRDLKPESGDEQENDASSKEDAEEVVQAVLHVLVAAEEPLYTKEIIRRVKSRGGEVEWDDFDHLLPENVNAQIRSDSDSRWDLVETPPDRGLESDGSEPVDENLQSREEVVASEPDELETPDSEDRRDEQQQDAFSPDGRVGEISSGLETAKQIALLLDLAPGPLSLDRIEELLNATGHDASESTVRYCLRSILNPFVQEEEDGYRLEDTGPELSEEELDAAPVDAATRATIGGQRYNYVFNASAQDGSSLFSSQIRGGTVEVKLNASHPAFRGLRQVLSDEHRAENSDIEQLRHLIKLLIASWTDMEGDLRGRRKEIAEEFREDWGRAVRLLLRERE